MSTPNSTRTITTIKQPYQTSGGETLYLGTETTVQVDTNGKYIPNSAEISLRLYTGTGVLGTDYKTVAIRNAGEQWRLTQDGNQNYVAGVDLRQTLANRNSMLNINLNNHVSNALQAPLQGVPARQVNTNTQSSANAAAGLPPTAGNARPDPPTATPPASSPDPQTNPQYFDGSVPYSGEPVTTKADPDYPLMYYPLKNRQDGTFDYLKVSAYRFLESGLRTDAQNFSVISTEDRRKSKAIGTVFLPMQPGISDTNGVSWNEDSINPFQAALGGVAAKAIATLGQGKVVAGAQGLFQGLINTGQNIANNPQLQNYISAYFAGQAVGTNLVARTTGTVLNNNLELLFNGPKLRSFRYSYRFTPREEDESKMIRKIIRFFKREMSTEKVANGLFLASPNVFKLEYISRDNNPNEFLNKIKFCALTDMSVNYTPDGSYMTYQDGSMTSYEVEFQFSELEPIYKNDYDSPTGLQGMGY
jgi:hypothetical protein